MGKFGALLRSTAGEKGLGTARGRWMRAISLAVDDLSNPNGLSYAGGRAQTAFVLESTSGSTPVAAFAFTTAGFPDANWIAAANFSARGGAQALMTRRRFFSTTAGVLVPLAAIEVIGQDYNPSAVGVDISSSGLFITFVETGVALTDIDWTLEWSVTRY